MREIVEKITCDKCGEDIENRKEWSVTASYWKAAWSGGESLVRSSWQAELCNECAEFVSSTLRQCGISVSFRCSED